MATQIQLRRDTAANWTSTNPTLAQGEPGLETDTGKIKYGDGSTAWTSLAYAESNQEFATGSPSSPSLTFTGDTNTGIYSPGPDQVAVSTGGAGRLFVDANGGVGVNTNTSAINAIGKLVVQNGSTSADERFMVAASGYLSGSTFTGTYIQQGDTATAGTTFGMSNVNLGRLVFQNTSAGLIGCNGGVPLVFGTSGLERLRITETGLVGIGTSAPSSVLEITSSSVESLLGVKAQGARNGYLDLDADANRRAVIRFNSAGATQWSIGRGDSDELLASSFHISTGSSGGGNAKFVVTSGGNVGIGTTSPIARLDVRGYTRVGNHTGTFQGLSIQNNEDSGSVETISFLDSINNLGIIDGHIFFGHATDGGSYIQLATTPAGSRSSDRRQERVRLDSSGRLLVGTSSSIDSASKLQVKDGYINIYHADSAENAGYGVNFSSDGGATGRTHARIALAQTAGNGGTLTFSVTADGASSPTERMRITSAGSLRIGQTTTDTPGFGNTTTGIGAEPANGALFLSRSSGSLLFINVNADSSTVAFRRSDVLVGNITVDATSTSYNTSSDYRLKENVTPVSDGITRLQQLKPSRFNFIADPDTVVDGFIAHEVQTIVPEAITGEKDAVDDEGNPEYQGIDQSKLVPLLTAALQEAIGEIESLKARLTAAGI